MKVDPFWIERVYLWLATFMIYAIIVAALAPFEMYAWNISISILFHSPRISYWQAASLIMVATYVRELVWIAKTMTNQ